MSSSFGIFVRNLGLCIFVWCCLVQYCFSKECNVRQYGAKADCVTLDSKSINSALSDPSCDSVVLDKGCFLSGSVRLQSRKTLIIQPEATLKAAAQNIDAFDHPLPNPWSQYQDFGHSHWRNALIWGWNVTDVRLTGGGSVDGNHLYTGSPVPDGAGDKLIGIVSSSRIEIDSLYLTHSGHFGLLATDVDWLDLHDLVVRPPRDGIDIVSCRHVRMTNCDIQGGGDDALVFKSDFSLGRVIHSYDVHVQNCTVGSIQCNGIQFGSETVGDFSDFHFENCLVTVAGDSGIGIASMDGSHLYDFTYKNIRMENVTSPIQLYIGARARHPPSVGRISGWISNIVIEDIVATRCLNHYVHRNLTIMFDGQPEDVSHGVTETHLIGPGIVLRNVDLSQCSVGGGWPIANPPVFPGHEEIGWYMMNSPRPSYGLFLRNLKGAEFDRVKFGWTSEDDRPSVMVTNSSDIELSHVQAARSKKVSYDIGLWSGVSNVRIKDSPGIVMKHLV